MKAIIRISLIILIIGLILSSCTAAEDIPTQTPPEIEESNAFGIVVNRPPFEDGGQVIPCKVIENYDSWNEFMEVQYGISIDFNMIPSLHATSIILASYYPSAISDGGMTGLIELNYKDYANIAVLRNLGLILPLDEYLKENSAYQGLSSSMKDAFVFADGKTWGLSATTSTSIYSRKLRKEWLSELDLALPQNLDELYAVSKAFAYRDPNGNGAADENGMDIYYNRTPEGLKDIFTAFECYLSNFGRSSIAYDLSTGSYEDSMLKPEMLEALKYIKGMLDENILHTNTEWSFSDIHSTTNGNYYGESARTISDDPDIYAQVYTLSEGEDKKVIVKGPEKCFVMSSNTENPHETINAFVDAFYGDLEGMLAGVYGERNVNYSLDDNIIINKWEGDFETKFLKNVLLLRPNYQMLYEQDIKLSESWLEGKVDHMEIMSRYGEDYATIIDLYMPLHSDYTKVQTIFTEKLNYFISNGQSIDIDTFIENYKNESAKAGFQDILDELNEDFGAVAKYRYN